MTTLNIFNKLFKYSTRIDLLIDFSFPSLMYLFINFRDSQGRSFLVCSPLFYCAILVLYLLNLLINRITTKLWQSLNLKEVLLSDHTYHTGQRDLQNINKLGLINCQIVQNLFSEISRFSIKMCSYQSNNILLFFGRVSKNLSTNLDNNQLILAYSDCFIQDIVKDVYYKQHSLKA